MLNVESTDQTDSPTIKAWPLPIPPRRHRLTRLVDPRARRHDLVPQTRQHGPEDGAVLHAPTAQAGVARDDLVEQVLRVEADGVVLRVVHLEVAPGDVGEEVALQDADEGEALGRVGRAGSGHEDGRAAVFGGQGDAVEELRDLGRRVDLAAEAVDVGHFGSSWGDDGSSFWEVC